MFNFDFNTAGEQRSGELIPDKTLCKLVMSLRPGGSGPDGWLTDSKGSDAQYLSCEFTVSEGPFARRKLWQNFVLSGGKLNDSGQSIAAEIARATLRAILESARNIRSDDMSPAACDKRKVQSFEEFDGIEFAAKIGVQKGKDGYQDSNKISMVLTPDKKEYQQVMSGQVAASPTQWSQPAQAQPKAAPAPAWASGPAPTNSGQAAQAKSTVPSWAS